MLSLPQLRAFFNHHSFRVQNLPKPLANDWNLGGCPNPHLFHLDNLFQASAQLADLLLADPQLCNPGIEHIDHAAFFTDRVQRPKHLGNL
jgi:hypothetical protein